MAAPASISSKRFLREIKHRPALAHDNQWHRPTSNHVVDIMVVAAVTGSSPVSVRLPANAAVADKMASGVAQSSASRHRRLVKPLSAETRSHLARGPAEIYRPRINRAGARLGKGKRSYEHYLLKYRIGAPPTRQRPPYPRESALGGEQLVGPEAAHRRQ